MNMLKSLHIIVGLPSVMLADTDLRLDYFKNLCENLYINYYSNTRTMELALNV